MVANLGSGDVAIGVSTLKDSGRVVLTLSNMNESKEVGSNVANEEVHNTPIVLTFDNVDGAIALRKAVQEVIKRMRDAEKAEAEKSLPRFTVPYKNVFVTNAFKSSNPDPQKIMTCYTAYQKDGKFDRNIEVTKNIVLKDGYVAYIVAGFIGANELEVVAPEGIEMKVGDETIRFMSDEIEVNYGMITKTGDIPSEAFYLTIKQGDEKYTFQAIENTDALEYLQKIYNVFKANFVFTHCSTMNVGLSEKMKEAGIPFTFK